MQQCFSLLHYIVSQQEHPWNQLATIYSKRRREILKQWLYLKTPANLTQHNILGLISKICHVVESSADKISHVLQGSQTNIAYFVCEFRDEIYLPVIAEGDPAPSDLLDVTQCQSTGQEVLYRGMWMPQAAPVTHAILQLSWWTGLLESIHSHQGNCTTS